MKVKQSRVLRTRVYTWAAGAALAACLMGYSAAPSYASEVSEAFVPKQAEIETSAVVAVLRI